MKLFAEEEELPNRFLDKEGENLLLLLLPELKLRGLCLKLRLGVGVVVDVVVLLKLNLDLVLEWSALVLEGDEVDAGLLVNLALDLDLVRSGALVVGSGTSEVACLLKAALCLEDDWAGLLTELLSFAASLGLACSIIENFRPTKSWPLTGEEVLYPLPSPLPAVGYLLRNLNVIQLGDPPVRGDKLSLGGDKDGSIATRHRGQVRDRDGNVLGVAPRGRGPHPVGPVPPQVGQPRQLLLLEAGPEGVGPADAEGCNNDGGLFSGR